MGGLLTTAALVPQVWRVYANQSAHDLSLPFLLITLLGIGLWLLYAVYRRLWMLLFWNGMAELLILALLVGKFRYGMHA